MYAVIICDIYIYAGIIHDIYLKEGIIFDTYNMLYKNDYIIEHIISCVIFDFIILFHYNMYNNMIHAIIISILYAPKHNQ